jgi:hypothetical protein
MIQKKSRTPKGRKEGRKEEHTRNLARDTLRAV